MSEPPPDLAQMLPAVLRLVAAAETAILGVYATGHEVEYKSDDSPITRADRAAHEILSAGLAKLAPRIAACKRHASPFVEQGENGAARRSAIARHQHRGFPDRHPLLQRRYDTEHVRVGAIELALAAVHGVHCADALRQ